MGKQQHASKSAQDVSTVSASKLLQTRPWQAETQASERQTPQSQAEFESISKGFDLTQPGALSVSDSSPPALGQPLQAKLTIGEPNDKYEQEADRVAKNVVQRIHTPQSEPIQQDEAIQRHADHEEDKLQMKPLLRRQAVLGGGDASSELEASINQAKGSGQALDPNLQQLMGQSMSADFSGVKVHTDAQADELNRSIQAKAFTTGQDVFFRKGEYNPSSKSGQELIAHELTHVVQQGHQSTMLHRMKFTTDDKITYNEEPFAQDVSDRGTYVTSSSGGIDYSLKVSAEKENDDPDDEWIVGFMQLGTGESFRARWISDQKSGKPESTIGEHQSNGWLLDSQQPNTLFDKPSSITHGKKVEIKGEDKGPSSAASTTYPKDDGDTAKKLASFRETNKFLTYAAAYNKTQDKIEPLKLLKWEAQMGAEDPGRVPAKGAMAIGVVDLSDEEADWEEIDGVGVEVTENIDAPAIPGYDESLFAEKWKAELEAKGYL